MLNCFSHCRSSETSLSSWPIMLCTLAASASREESRWSDCIEMNRKLSKLYELKNQQHYAGENANFTITQHRFQIFENIGVKFNDLFL